jgi:hypothetical protein
MKIFIAGPRAIKTLNSAVKNRLENIMNQNFTIYVGDANGIDKQIQQFCFDNHYKLVKVFASNGKARNNIGEWEVEFVEVPSTVKGFDFYAAKDFEMAKDANYGFMIWNGKSKGTLNNMYNLLKFNKKILVYLTSTKLFYVIKTMEDIESLKSNPTVLTKNEDTTKEFEQIKLF